MGIYLFNRVVLERILRECDGLDFGRDVIPYAVRSDYRVSGHSFTGYWEDIGTIASFYAANLGMVSTNPPIDLFDPAWDMYTRPRFLPPSKVQESKLESVLMAEGCRVSGSEIKRSVVGIRSIVKEGTKIENSILMGADFYVPEHGESRLPVMGIGRNVTIRRAIVDKNVRIGDSVEIVNEAQRQHADGPGWAIRDGIVVIEKGAVIPPGTVI
jgi:glucose-1-phosphate adenylyltransferase